MESSAKKRRISHLYNVSAPGDFAKDAFKNFDNYRKDGFLCDFRLMVEDTAFKVHRNVLASRSKYFKLFFDVYPQHEALKLGKVEKSAVQQCIEFIYTGEITLSVEGAEPVLQVARSFQLREIFELYFTYLCSNLCVSNCLLIKDIAEKFTAKKLVSEAHQFIAENLDSITDDKDFVKIKKQDLINYVKKTTKASCIWKTITIWASYEPARKNQFPDILSSLKMSVFSLEDLENMTGNKLVSSSHKCIEFVANEIFQRFQVGKEKFNFKMWNFMKSLSKSYNLFQLQHKINNHILKNFTEISETLEFYKIEKSDFFFFVKSMPLGPGTEKTIWVAVTNWVRFEEPRKKWFLEILKELNPSKFSPGFIKNVVTDDNLVASNNDCLKLFINAVCNLLPNRGTFH